LILQHRRAPANLNVSMRSGGVFRHAAPFSNAFNVHPSLTVNLFLPEGVHRIDASSTECRNIGCESRDQQYYGRHNEIQSRLIDVKVKEKRAEQSG